MATGSAYQQIRRALTAEGRLPRGFALSEAGRSGAPSHAPGARDGIALYHTRLAERTEQAAELTVLFQQYCREPGPALWRKLAAFFQQEQMLCLADPFLEAFERDPGGLTPREVYQAAQTLMTEAEEPELVKLGIAASGLLHVADDLAMRQILLVLGCYDEFTLYVLVAVSTWPDAALLIFELAQATRGWGRIHAVERLRPVTEAARDWLITSGWQNQVSPAYSALTCAEQADLLAYLERDALSAPLFQGATEILAALLEEAGPRPGLRDYRDAHAAVARYLEQAARRPGERVTRLAAALERWRAPR